MATKDEEKTIIGAWLLGFHTEDQRRADASDFICYPRIAKEIIGGQTDPFKISDVCGIPIKDMAEMVSGYAEFFYEAAFKNLLKRRVQQKIISVTSESDMGEVLAEYEDYITYGSPQLPPHAENFAQLLIDNLDSKSKQETARTGIPGLDKCLNGIKRKEMTVVAARPSVGKSAFGVQLIRKLAEQNKKVLYFPLEMSVEANLERMLLHSGVVSPRVIESGILTQDEWEKVTPELEEIDRLAENIYIYESVNDINTIAALTDTEKPYAIVIDQLEQLRCKGEKFKDKRERFSYMTSTLQHIAMSRNVAVILMCQVSRSAQDSEPTMANLKESGSIEEDADNVIMLHRFKPGEMKNPAAWSDSFRPVMIKLEKHRHGATGNTITAFKPEQCRFVEVDNG